MNLFYITVNNLIIWRMNTFHDLFIKKNIFEIIWVIFLQQMEINSLDHTIHQLVYEIMEKSSKHAPNKTLREILYRDYYTLERNTISSSIVILLDCVLLDIAKYSSHISIILYVKCKEYYVAYENYLKSKKKGARSNK